MLAAWLSQRPGSKRKSLSPAVKHKSHLTADLLWDSACVRVSDWAWGSDWKFAHHSLKANSVQVLGPIVPQYVGSAVRAGCTPVLDLCHLWRRRRRDEMRKTHKKRMPHNVLSLTSHLHYMKLKGFWHTVCENKILNRKGSFSPRISFFNLIMIANLILYWSLLEIIFYPALAAFK